MVFVDRTAVLFLGIAAGTAIGYAFAAGGERPSAAPPAEPATQSPPPSAPPPASTAPATAPAAGFECALPFQQTLLETVATGRPVTVGVFGDSFGDGVWTALYRLLPARERFRVLKHSQQSTGFTRYASLNLEDHTRAQLAADGPVDVAVISFGANDTQAVYVDGRAAPLMSPAWQRVIGTRIDAFVALLRGKGAMVYWVGLPKMRAEGFDADIAAMNHFYAARMAALRVPFIDVRPMTTDASGAYAAYLPDPTLHEPRLMRANDGIHMSMNGYIIITRALADRIKAYVAAARVVAAGGAVPAVPIAPPPPPAPAPP
ncbi:MAG: lipase, partial [Sphingomonas bacterium]|nr:lipase [Sphingomonas bacterium]